MLLRCSVLLLLIKTVKTSVVLYQFTLINYCCCCWCSCHYSVTTVCVFPVNSLCYVSPMLFCYIILLIKVLNIHISSVLTFFFFLTIKCLLPFYPPFHNFPDKSLPFSENLPLLALASSPNNTLLLILHFPSSPLPS